MRKSVILWSMDDSRDAKLHKVTVGGQVYFIDRRVLPKDASKWSAFVLKYVCRKGRKPFTEALYDPI